MTQNGDQIAQLAGQLDDAYLVIGRQQVTLLQMEQAIKLLRQRTSELEQQLEKEPVTP